MIRIEDHMPEFSKKNTVIMALMVEQMANDILNISRQHVPLKSGELHQSGEIEKVSPGHAKVWYGRKGRTGEYAAIQENKQFENYTTPDTGSKYLENAGDKVERDQRKYLAQAARRAVI